MGLSLQVNQHINHLPITWLLDDFSGRNHQVRMSQKKQYRTGICDSQALSVMSEPQGKKVSHSKKSEHDSKIERALAFIETNLDRTITLNEVAGVASLSRNHFHRVFTETVGITVGKYIQRRRFKRACYQLAFHRDITVTEVAFEAQYATPESFTKSFKKELGITPKAFRHHPNFSAWSGDSLYCDKGNQSMTIEITNFKKTTIAAKQHNGPIRKIGETLRQFIEWRKKHGPSPDVSRTFNIYYDDPELVAAENYRMDVGAELLSTLKPNDFGVVKTAIPDHLCAKMRHHGSWDGLGSAMRHLYSEWLPASQYEVGSFPMFVHRINLHPQVLEADLKSDIYLPIRAKSHNSV